MSNRGIPLQLPQNGVVADRHANLFHQTLARTVARAGGNEETVGGMSDFDSFSGISLPSFRDAATTPIICGSSYRQFLERSTAFENRRRHASFSVETG